MIPLYHDPHFTFRFADDRIIPKFHLEGVEAGQTSEGVEWRTTTRRRDDLISSDPANVLVIPYEVEVEVAWRDGRTSRSLV